VKSLPVSIDENLIIGMDRPDDAGVYRVSDNLALIQTLDFFTPVVDDPYSFGQIAAANSLSDVYAMGGEPKLAMNIICFPVGTMDVSVLEEVLKGGSDKMREAGVLLVGGHSVEDAEIKYGLSVTGFVHPDKVLRNTGAKPGDVLVLTKPIGTGIIATAIKASVAGSETIEHVIKLMSELNRKPAEIMKKYNVHACTDVTGFGLIGHAAEIIEATGSGIILHADKIPVMQEALEFASMGFIPAGAYRNRDFRIAIIENQGIDDDRLMCLFDPQTSGGLLIALPFFEADALVKELKESGIGCATIIGEIIDSNTNKIIII
jgi:selenide, water dikinase